MMANFTMELNELLNDERIGVFTFDYAFYSMNPSDKQTFERTFTDTYYFYEIGFETPERFKKHLQARLDLIMPYYQQLAMTEWDKVKTAEQMMTSKNLTETSTHEQIVSGNQSSNISSSGESSGNNQSTSTQQSTIDNKQSQLADGVSQASLTDGYLTGVDKSESTGTGTDNVTSTQTQTNEQTGTSTTEQTIKDTTTFTSKGDVGIQTPAYAITEWRKVIININQMIIEDCKDLFMKIY